MSKVIKSVTTYVCIGCSCKFLIAKHCFFFFPASFNFCSPPPPPPLSSLSLSIFFQQLIVVCPFSTVVATRNSLFLRFYDTDYFIKLTATLDFGTSTRNNMCWKKNNLNEKKKKKKDCFRTVVNNEWHWQRRSSSKQLSVLFFFIIFFFFLLYSQRVNMGIPPP